MNKSTKQLPPELPDLKEAIDWASDHILDVDPACAAVPDISPDDFQNHVDSIREDGLLFPILVSAERSLLDGRCRLRACFQLDRKLKSHEVLIVNACPEAIAAANIARRQMTVDQLLIHTAKKLPRVREDALARKRRGKKAGKEDVKKAGIESSRQRDSRKASRKNSLLNEEP